ncbi:MAG: hypothetical protein M0R17_00265 [Candidatus Omnitrophica bacterium]|jgi:hypothetical protein|nr:hypothetical protein [Candidatus Omnitrophota bacterium]
MNDEAEIVNNTDSLLIELGIYDEFESSLKALCQFANKQDDEEFVEYTRVALLKQFLLGYTSSVKYTIFNIDKYTTKNKEKLSNKSLNVILDIVKDINSNLNRI